MQKGFTPVHTREEYNALVNRVNETGKSEWFYVTDQATVPFGVNKTTRYTQRLKNKGVVSIDAFVCSAYDGGAEFHYAAQCYKYKGLLITPVGEYGKKTCSFAILGDDTNYNEYGSKYYEREHPAPKRAATVTPQTIDAWGDWLSKRREAARAFFKEREDEIEKFLALVKATKSPADVCDEKHGTITRCGLSFSYTIDYYRMTIHRDVKMNQDLRFATFQDFISSPNTQTKNQTPKK